MSLSRLYPALDVSWPDPPADDTIDRLIADLDDTAPTAIEAHETGVRVFFTTTEQRDHAIAVVAAAMPPATVVALSVSDDQWAERSQAALTPVRVGRIVVAPPWTGHAAGPTSDAADIVVVIQPSMGFGTGHHQSTRLCLRLLQEQSLADRSVLDAGTGSGVLAIAAWRLGAGRVTAIDIDEDAITSARENLDLNRAAPHVRLEAVDLATASHMEPSDVVTANLTGAMLERHAGVLAQCVARGGALIASGFQRDEEDAVAESLGRLGLDVASRVEEDDWVALSLLRRLSAAIPMPSTAR